MPGKTKSRWQIRIQGPLSAACNPFRKAGTWLARNEIDLTHLAASGSVPLERAAAVDSLKCQRGPPQQRLPGSDAAAAEARLRPRSPWLDSFLTPQTLL